MKLVGFSVASIAGIIFAFPASALTISNVDPEPHTIIVTAGTDTKELTVEPDQQVDLITLMWVGRGDYRAEEWQRALADARDRWNERTAEYLIETPLLSDYLSEGLDRLGVGA